MGWVRLQGSTRLLCLPSMCDPSQFQAPHLFHEDNKGCEVQYRIFKDLEMIGTRCLTQWLVYRQPSVQLSEDYFFYVNGVFIL